MEKESNYYYEPTIKTARKPFIHYETGTKVGEEIITTYKICTDDCISKKQLISFLENKIKEYDKSIKEYAKPISKYVKAKKIALLEVLDFVNKGGKE